MDCETGFPQETRTAEHPYGVVLHDEHRLLRAAARVDDLYRWRDRLVAELTRPESAYARAMIPASRALMHPDDPMPYAIFLERWSRIVAATIQRLQRVGAVAKQQTPEDLATAILAAVHGGVLLARVTDDVRALRNAVHLAFEQLVLHKSENWSD